MISPLSQILLKFSEWDNATGRDACEGTLALGAPGGGKTAIIGKMIAMQMLKAGMGGLVLTAKASETERWLRYAEEAGRGKDVILFSEASGLHYDPLAFEFGRSGRGAGDSEAVIETFGLWSNVGKPKLGSSSNDVFWENSSEQLIRNNIKLLSLAGERISIANIHQFIQTMPNTPIRDGDFDEWAAKEGNYCGQVVSKIRARWRELSESDKQDAQIALGYVGDKWPHYDPETRGGVEMTFQSVADKFVFGSFRRIFSSGKYDFTPRDCTERQKIILSDFPMLEYGQQTGMLVNTIVKLSCQRDWLRRKIDPNSDAPITFLWMDEAQYHLTPGSGGISKDNLFQQSCREARIAPVYITQNILNFAEALGEHTPGSRTKSFLGNIRLKFFLQQNDVDTNQYAADLIGKYYGELRGHSEQLANVTLSSNQQLLYRVNPFEFTSLLKPDAERFMCEAIVYQGGKEFLCSRDEFGNPLNCARLMFK